MYTHTYYKVIFIIFAAIYQLINTLSIEKNIYHYEVQL